MFTFEHTYQLSEAEYVTLWSPLNQHSAMAKVWGATTVALAQRHAVEFDSVEAHSQFHELTGGK